MSGALYRAIAETSPLGVFATDASGRCTYTNARWQEIFGLSMAQSLSYGWSAAVHGEDRALVTCEWLRAGNSI